MGGSTESNALFFCSAEPEATGGGSKQKPRKIRSPGMEIRSVFRRFSRPGWEEP